MAKQPVSNEIEIGIGPHSARRDWAVLRVSYPKTPEAQWRIARVLDLLIGPLPDAATAETVDGGGECSR